MKKLTILMLLSAAFVAQAAVVTTTGSDGFGASSLISAGVWSNAAEPSAGNDYVIDDEDRVRTPADGGVYTFAGDSLTVQAVGSGGDINIKGLSYKGTGNTGSITIDNLILDGGSINHINGSIDIFNLYGNITAISDSIIYAKQGPINIYSAVHGSATINVLAASYSTTFYSAGNTFTGDIVNNGNFILASSEPNVPVLNFVIGANGVCNTVSGTGATTFNGQFAFDLSAASTNAGDMWPVVTATNVTYGDTFNVLDFTDMGNDTWELIANGTKYQFEEASGLLRVYTPELIEDPISYVIWASEYPVINGDLSLPGYAVNPGWDGETLVDIPGWTAMAPGTTDGGTGVGDSADGDGFHAAFNVMDPDVYNYAELPMVEGVSYTYTIMGKPRWGVNSMNVSIIADDDPNIPLATTTVPFPADHIGDGADLFTQGVVTYTATADDAGKNIGIYLSSDDTDGGWIRFDDVHLYSGYTEIHAATDMAPEGTDIEPTVPIQLTWSPCNDPNMDGVNYDSQILYYYIANGNGTELDYGAYIGANGIELPLDASSYDIIAGMTVDQYCMWRVDTILDGTTYTGRTVTFVTRTADLAPVISDWDWWITWVGNTATIWATVDDAAEGDIDLSGIEWSVTNGEGIVGVTDVSTDALYPHAEVTATAAGEYNVQLVVTDTDGSLGAQSSTPANFVIRVADDACAAAAMSGVPYNAYDADQDCDVDMADLAAFATQWLGDISLTEAVAY